jgi:hypothetical protein
MCVYIFCNFGLQFHQKLKFWLTTNTSWENIKPPLKFGDPDFSSGGVGKYAIVWHAQPSTKLGRVWWPQLIYTTRDPGMQQKLRIFTYCASYLTGTTGTCLYFSWCTVLAWWNIPGHGCTLHSSRWLGYLLTQVFLNRTIYADSRSHKKYTILYFPSIPGEGHKSCILGSPDPSEFSWRGYVCQTRH